MIFNRVWKFLILIYIKVSKKKVKRNYAVDGLD